jgi:hypothetical protein
MQQLSASVTAAAIMTGSVFPNVTQPYFEITSGYVDGMGGIMSAAFAPLVRDDHRPQWEDYARRSQGWIAQAETLRLVHPGHRDPMHGTNQDHEHDRRRRRLQTTTKSSDDSVTPPIFETIFKWENGTKVPEPTHPQNVYAPLWQVSPPDGASVNANLFSEPVLASLYKAMITINHTVLSTATPIGDMFDFLFDDAEKDRKQNPHAYIMEPVFAEFAEAPELVGVLVAVTTFGNLLDRLLPEGANGVICVITDTCGNTVSYELNGRLSTFLGHGDSHDAKFDSFRRTAPLELYDVVGKESCDHGIFIYPSSKLIASYQTRTPLVYAGIVLLAFLLTSILFFIYDQTVTRRQEKTMKSALRSGALVDKLYPATIRDRVMDGAAAETEHKNGRKKFASIGPRFQELPIAEFYPHTTLMCTLIVLSGPTFSPHTLASHSCDRGILSSRGYCRIHCMVIRSRYVWCRDTNHG